MCVGGHTVSEEGGSGLIWGRPSAAGALHRAPAAHRGPGLCRHAWQRSLPVREGLQHAAAAPEGVLVWCALARAQNLCLIALGLTRPSCLKFPPLQHEQYIRQDCYVRIMCWAV